MSDATAARAIYVGNTRQIAANIQLMIASVTVYPSSEFAFT